jgi:hypothetical protein
MVCRSARSPAEAQLPSIRLAAEQHDEGDTLQHVDGGVWQTERALQQAAAGIDAAEQQRDR